MQFFFSDGETVQSKLSIHHGRKKKLWHLWKVLSFNDIFSLKAASSVESIKLLYLDKADGWMDFLIVSFNGNLAVFELLELQNI